MDKALGLLPLLLAWEACAVVSADSNCEASEGQGLILCSQTDCVLNPTMCHRTCKADAEININSAELEAFCCLYLLAFFFFLPLCSFKCSWSPDTLFQLWLGQVRDGHPSPPPGQVRILPNPFLSHCLCFETGKQTLQ